MIARSGRAIMLGVAVVSAAWLGGVALFGAVVAPAAFDVLPSRTLAGALVGRVLPALFISGIVVGLVVAAAAGSARSGRARGWAVTAGASMVIACAAAQFLIGARIERVRASASAPLDELPAGDPLRVTFGRLHGLSVAGLGVAAVAAGAALVLLLRSSDDGTSG